VLDDRGLNFGNNRELIFAFTTRPRYQDSMTAKALQHMMNSCRTLTATLAFAVLLGFTAAAPAQSLQSPVPMRLVQVDQPKDQSDLDTLKQRDLETLRAQQKEVAETEAKLKLEIASIGEDRRKLNQALIATATRLRDAESRIVESEIRLKMLDEDERGIRQSLDGRRAVIAEVLAALQRIGRHPPPAVMIKPEDALASVRTAMMLDAVLPEMRGQVKALASELAAMVGIRKNIAEEQERLRGDLAVLTEERLRVARLIEERQKKQSETEKALEAERQRAVILALEVGTLNDLISKLEQDLDRATRAARAVEDRRSSDSRPELAALKDPGRLAPAVAFSATQGHLSFPVNGVRIREFGAPDTAGGTEKGLSIAARAGAQVTSPCDGWVVYAAPFRNYGQVLILDAGGGYHVVLTGMDRISVGVGQFVLTGEPVATMGSGSQMTATVTTGSIQSVLYVEFRKDGTPVDPSPWWASSKGEKVRG
jgi:septal ring factor EnvC (AmiA/AmiB activator)